MKSHCLFILTATLILSLNAAYSQESDSSRFNLTKASADETAKYAVWRTDYYICTGIAYAKSMGKTTDDFMTFVAQKHGPSLNSMKGKGLEPVVNFLNFVITNYPNGTFEIVSESQTTVKVKANRPYTSYFKEGLCLGVTIDEFEKCFWGHAQLMLKTLGIEFKYWIEGDSAVATLTLNNVYLKNATQQW
ncbi:hypothetical protein INQ51_17640 [Maribellus sp. CM-23]|uniref:hypothetical protein n=1 Tax=Maribellus sp. CM-23 TaxID=2781026 RepID=UPI001F2B4849|nr:hypothetical protein [Maribellus sp. CM-23]MCE4566147.1 hypothetical protein [Maribellus sp. CM-23]